MKTLRLLVAAATWLGISFNSAAADDPYLWLEQRHGERALAWVAEQNEATRAAITRDPRFAAYWDEALKLFSDEDKIPYIYQQGSQVYNFWQDGNNVLGVWRRTSFASYRRPQPHWETIIDFDALAAKEGVDWVFGYADCLWPDFTRCLVQMSPDGGDAVEIREFDLKEKRFVENGFVSPVSKSGLSWLDRDTLIVSAAYTGDEQTSSGYPRVVKIWRRGQKLENAATVFEGGVNDLSTYGYAAYDNVPGRVFISRNLDFYNTELLLVGGNRDSRRVPLPTDQLISSFFGDQLVFSLRSAWTAPDGTVLKPGGLYSFNYQAWNESDSFGKVSVLLEPSPRVSISGVSSTARKLFVTLVDNVRGKVLAFSLNDGVWTSETVALPENGDVTISHTDYDGSSISFSFQDFLTPPSLIWSDSNGAKLEALKSLAPRFDSSLFVSEQFEATSKDGTKVPYFVVRPKEQAAPAPTLLYGYGGFEVSMTPWYSGGRGKLWLEKGNVFVLANIRGGGEFGPEWHQAALKGKRQNSYDDFAAVAEDLIARRITTPAQLGVQGGSNGGLLAGVMLTQRPDLFGAVISDVPLLDMLRYTELPPGASWIAEYGDPAIPEEAAWIARYSPYQNVRREMVYPSVLFTTSTADDRVHPGHARKMAALMQGLGYRAMFFENTEGGHGGSGDIRTAAMTYATQYLFLQRYLEGGANSPSLLAEAFDPGADRSPVETGAAAEAGLACAQASFVLRQAATGRKGGSAGLATRQAELQRNCVRLGKTPPQ